MQIIHWIDSFGISQVLDGHLEAAKTKNVPALLQVFVSNGFFLGTDDTEKWSVGELAQNLQESDHG